MSVLGRIASAGPSLARTEPTWRWMRNFDRALKHRIDPERTVDLAGVALELAKRGVATRPAEELLSERGVRMLSAITPDVQERVRAEVEPSASDEVSPKTYIRHLLQRLLDVDGPYVRLALDPALLAIASQYLGMRPYLRTIDVWLNYPTPGEASETQLWHRDSDDLMNLKVFIYLSDVGIEQGPFCYVPGSHPKGQRRVSPESSGGRTTDDQMRAHAGEAEWRFCTGPAGSVVLADTTGFHKGLKPHSGHRLLLMIQYTSGHPAYPRDFDLLGLDRATLTPNERAALVQ